LISLIDNGFDESIDDIEKHMYEEDLLQYLISKYKDAGVADFTVYGEDAYPLDDINNYICDMASYVNGNESRKYCVGKDENGLLLLISVCFDLGNGLVKIKE
jgi:allantoicase